MKTKIRHFGCECSGGGKYCGYLRIITWEGDKDIEINFVKKIKDKKVTMGIYLGEKGVKKLKALL
jgi:hypothetical protein